MRQRTITVVGARGGHGATTVAAALAVYAAGHVPTRLVAADTGTAAALLGIPAPGDAGGVRVTPTLTLAERPEEEAEVVVVDAGTAAQARTAVAEAGECYAVLGGPCYLGLHTLTTQPGLRLAGVVLVAELGRSLDARDVEDVLGVAVVATVHCTPTVARAVDAGLFVARLHRLGDLKALRALVVPHPALAGLSPSGLEIPTPAHGPTSAGPVGAPTARTGSDRAADAPAASSIPAWRDAPRLSVNLAPLGRHQHPAGPAPRSGTDLHGRIGARAGGTRPVSA